MALLEDPHATWEKRYEQVHYGYRDFASVTTLPLTEAQALGLALIALAAGNTTGTTLYTFGVNAKAKVNPGTGLAYGTVNWPANCLGRKILIYATEDAYVSLISLNPEYIKQVIAQTYTDVVPTASQLIYEVDELILSGTFYNFSPTLGAGIIFRAATLLGTLRIWIGGNVEGGE